jgi:hypothetical protein
MAKAQRSERWVVRRLGDGPAFYVQDSALGYCTEPTTERAARAEARERNRTERN